MGTLAPFAISPNGILLPAGDGCVTPLFRAIAAMVQAKGASVLASLEKKNATWSIAGSTVTAIVDGGAPQNLVLNAPDGGFAWACLEGGVLVEVTHTLTSPADFAGAPIAGVMNLTTLGGGVSSFKLPEHGTNLVTTDEVQAIVDTALVAINQQIQNLNTKDDDHDQALIDLAFEVTSAVQAAADATTAADNATAAAANATDAVNNLTSVVSNHTTTLAQHTTTIGNHGLDIDDLDARVTVLEGP